MKVKDVLTDGLESTSLMTLFSYLVLGKKDKNYKEPLLLGKVVHKEGLEKPFAKPTGWALHYGFGVLWSAGMRVLMKKTGIKPTVLAGLLLGAVGGLVGVAAWRPVVKRFRLMKSNDARRFYAHLVLTHIVFTVTLMREMSRQS